MIKNKDGSYNKFSLLLIGAIIIIAIGIIGSVLTQSDISMEQVGPVLILILIIGAAIYAFKIISSRKPIKSSMDPVVVQPEKIPSSPPSPSIPYTPSSYVEYVPPVSEIDKEIDKSLKRYEKTQHGSSSSSINIVSLIITMVVAAATMVIGLTVVNSMINAMPQLQEGSAFSTTQTEIMNTMGSAFNFMALGLIVVSAIFIIGLVSKVMVD